MRKAAWSCGESHKSEIEFYANRSRSRRVSQERSLETQWPSCHCTTNVSRGAIKFLRLYRRFDRKVKRGRIWDFICKSPRARSSDVLMWTNRRLRTNNRMIYGTASQNVKIELPFCNLNGRNWFCCSLAQFVTYTKEKVAENASEFKFMSRREAKVQLWSRV